MKNVFIFCSLFLSISFQTLYAQEKPASESVNLSEVEVNANRNKLYSEMGRILTVVDKTEITRSAVQSIDQLLDYVAGIDIRQRGMNGTQADISVRGGSFDQVLVLLNGVNITDPQTGHFNLDIPLDISDVTRVEILQGSSARILGPNAFSGAINIVTEKDGKKALNAQLVGGSYNYLAQNISGNFGTDQIQTFASVSHKSSSGYMSNTDFDFLSAFAQSVFKTKTAGKFDLQLAAQQKSFGANGFYALAYPNQYEHSKTFLTALNWTLNKGKVTYSAQTYWRRHHDRFELDFNNPAGWNYHLTDVTGGKTTASYQSKIGKTTIGVDIRNEHIFSNKLGLWRDSLAVPFETNVYFTKEANRLLSTCIIDHSVNIGKWYLSIGAASTYCEAFGFSTYGGVDLAYTFNENARVFVSANSASRLPTFTDLYYNSTTQKGDPNLKPEQSKTLEIGTKINHSQWRLNASVFYRMGENVIDWVKFDAAPTSKYEVSNLANVNARGTDISGEHNFNGLFIEKITASYSYLQLDKAAVGFDSKYALDYLKHKAILSITHHVWNRLSASWKASYLDRSGNYKLSSTTPAVAYAPYFLLDTRILWSQNKFDAFADVNNILNSNYADYGGLTQPGTNFNIGIRLKL